MKVDMSPAAIASRLRQVEQLRRLCLSLGKAKPAKDGPAGVAGVEKKRNLFFSRPFSGILFGIPAPILTPAPPARKRTARFP
jgi:hypothetical protein